MLAIIPRKFDWILMVVVKSFIISIGKIFLSLIYKFFELWLPDIKLLIDDEGMRSPSVPFKTILDFFLIRN